MNNLLMKYFVYSYVYYAVFIIILLPLGWYYRCTKARYYQTPQSSYSFKYCIERRKHFIKTRNRTIKVHAIEEFSFSIEINKIKMRTFVCSV